MKTNKDSLIICPCCGSDACLETQFNPEFSTWLCWTCGYNTNSHLVEGSNVVTQNEENTAELIKDLKQVHGKLAWFPTVLNIQDKGMVFPEGQSIDEWHWKAVKAIPIEPEEQHKFPIPGKSGEYYKYKMDMKNPKVFDKFNFMDAAEEIGLFE